MARMTSPSGGVVEVDDAKVERLADMGFVPVKAAKAPAKSAESSTTSKRSK